MRKLDRIASRSTEVIIRQAPENLVPVPACSSERKLEFLVDALSTYNGFREPMNPCYQARNPLSLQVFTEEGVATGKLRRFDSLHGGYLAAIYDLRIKCSGRSRANLRGELFNLEGLVRVYNMHMGYADGVSKYLRKAIQDPSITTKTTLDYFLRDNVDSAQAELKEAAHA